MSTLSDTAKPVSKIANGLLWCLQVLAALAFLGAGFGKLSGAPMMIKVFEAVGMGQWFRYLTGFLEVSGAILLLIPRLCGPGALLLCCIMVGAIFTHLFKIGGNPTPPIVLLLIVGTIAWGRRDTIMRLLGRQ